MEFISNSNSQRYRDDYIRNIKQITYSNFNYKASNEHLMDNVYLGVDKKYTIRPDINITYPIPFNTGKCVLKKERKSEPFDIHKQPRLFSDLVDNAKEENKEVIIVKEESTKSKGVFSFYL